MVITWAWGQDEVINGFDPATDTIFIDWIGAADLEVTETAVGVVFAVPSNNQTTTLAGVHLSELSEANFTILDSGAAAEVLALVGDGTGTRRYAGRTRHARRAGHARRTGHAGRAGYARSATVNARQLERDGRCHGGHRHRGDHLGLGHQPDDHRISIPASDTIFIDWFGPEAIDVAEVNGDTVFTMASNNQTLTLAGIGLADCRRPTSPSRARQPVRKSSARSASGDGTGAGRTGRHLTNRTGTGHARHA